MPEAYGGQTLAMKVALSRLTTLAAGAAALAFFLACGGTGHAHDTPGQTHEISPINPQGVASDERVRRQARRTYWRLES
jgi:hypothetical protein